MSGVAYGGQGLIEGVFMRGRRSIAVALRHPDGHIIWATETLAGRLRLGCSSLVFSLVGRSLEEAMAADGVPLPPGSRSLPRLPLGRGGSRAPEAPP